MWPNRIMCAVDFSPASHQALAVAEALAMTTGAALTVVHAVDPALSGIEGAVYGTTETLMARRERAWVNLTDWVAAARLRVPQASGEVVEGPPSRAIVEVARRHGADMIIMGTHGRSRLARALTGSVVAQVMRRAPCPVMAVREGTVHEAMAATESSQHTAP